MEYVQVNSIDDPMFARLHKTMQDVFPPEEVLEYELWAEPLKDPTIRVFLAVQDDEVAGITEYRYNKELNVAMTDFTIIVKEGRGVGPFLAKKRHEDLMRLAEENDLDLTGMFAEIYDPYRMKDHAFASIKVMDPFVRREVLSHLGYMRLDFPYVHPAWTNEGEAVSHLDLCFQPFKENIQLLKASLIRDFITSYYSVLSNKPQEWHDMVANLEKKDEILLKPL
ncbi:GNAT family N-acetyltransferase [Domibacillus sp. DTU_2020_1001157_1_SI_ALB_TIR_016]|uniref:GNAT family N-acetyltransferase n=1 Tax=Domibacillus sp. DTU_2020_1001157_1_SI_ALB_TIR_016 TaxID=3077789 RepID=UPI0028E3CD9A|nr:GNAT family N-acetyltransferase [Domibacillus sp. DTU_2020_1001157_1_SI_ALB_TIR_016]WNS80911.1 GNAT family N-acetyltransferase [Domibacillus sp. DTU_2020_1001157_1_SI_ALB_TIR_016]